MDLSIPDMAQNFNIRRSRLKRMFKRFLLAKYKKEKETSKYEYDPIEKMSEQYCINGKKTSEISLFQDRLFKTELTNEYLFGALKKNLKDEDLLDDLLDVNLDPKQLESSALSDRFLSYLFDKLRTGEIASDRLLSKLEKKLGKRLIKYDFNSKPRKLNKDFDSARRRKFRKIKKRPCGQDLPIKLSRTKSSLTLSSDSAAQKRLDKFNFYPIALDQFGNRLENYRLPKESVYHLLVNLTNSIHTHNKSKCTETSVNIVDNILKSETDRKIDRHYQNIKKDSLKSLETSHAENAIPFTDKNLQNLFERKAKVKTNILAETSLLSRVQKIKPDRQGWKNKICLSVYLMKLGNKEAYNKICKKIEDTILRKITEEERAKVKYWSLLYGEDEGTKGPLSNAKETINNNEIYKNKKYTYRTINEYMLSRDYDNESQANIEDIGSDSDVSFDSFKLHVLEKLDTDLPSKDAAEFRSFFGESTEMNNIQHTKAGVNEIKNNVDEVERFPFDPYLEEKTSYISRLTQVRGQIVKNDELSKPQVENMYPFGSKTTRGLSPIKRFKPNKNDRRENQLLNKVDRIKFIQTEGRTKAKLKQSKRFCEQPVTQRHYNWEKPKILGKQVLPGTDVFIQAPKIKELKEEEDSWKYNLPPFDYMSCGLPKDSFELVSNQILQKEILDQELMDLKREEYERKKADQWRLHNKDIHNNVKQSQISGLPPPWHYNVTRWPIERKIKQKITSNLLSQPNFVQQTIHKYCKRDSGKKYCERNERKRPPLITKAEPVEKEVMPGRGIKYWRNISLEGLKTKEA